MYDYLAEKAGLRSRSLISDMLATRRTGAPWSKDLQIRRQDIATEAANKQERLRRQEEDEKRRKRLEQSGTI